MSLFSVGVFVSSTVEEVMIHDMIKLDEVGCAIFWIMLLLRF